MNHSPLLIIIIGPYTLLPASTDLLLDPSKKLLLGYELLNLEYFIVPFFFYSIWSSLAYALAVILSTPSLNRLFCYYISYIKVFTSTCLSTTLSSTSRISLKASSSSWIVCYIYSCLYTELSFRNSSRLSF